MTETKWTKGPWLIKSETPYYSITCFNRSLCEVVPTYDDKSQYNANLIAAAPDLYAATDWDWLIKLENESLDDDQGGDNDFPIKLTVGQIRALINARRKARGE